MLLENMQFKKTESLHKIIKHKQFIFTVLSIFLPNNSIYDTGILSKYDDANTTYTNTNDNNNSKKKKYLIIKLASRICYLAQTSARKINQHMQQLENP